MFLFCVLLVPVQTDGPPEPRFRTSAVVRYETVTDDNFADLPTPKRFVERETTRVVGEWRVMDDPNSVIINPFLFNQQPVFQPMFQTFPPAGMPAWTQQQAVFSVGGNNYPGGVCYPVNRRR